MPERTVKVDTGEVYVVGLGPGDPMDLPPLNLSLMQAGGDVYLRTRCHPVVPFLEKEGVKFASFDDFYEKATSFEQAYRQMADFLITAAQGSDTPVVFGVPGHPLVGESVVRHLLEMGPKKGVRVRLWPAPSFLEAVCGVLGLDPAQGILMVDGFELCRFSPEAPSFFVPRGTGVLVAQVYNRVLASEAKLTLMEHFPDDHPVALVRAAGVRGEERVEKIPLYRLDRCKDLDHLTTLYLPPFTPESDSAPRYVLDPLVEVMNRLLGPGGCPWDRRQTHETLKKYLIEEAYEVIDAIDEGNMHKLCEELGDLLLQVIFHAALAARDEEFNLSQVIAGITEKLKRRHPHVFGTGKAKNAAEVLRNWEAIKREEKEGSSLLGGIPRDLPALQRAQKVQGKAALVGFDWPDPQGAAAKLEEEWQELRAAWARNDAEAVRTEAGDFFFAAVNLARLLKVNAEEALRAAVDKFTKRFRCMEEQARERGTELQGLSLAELDALWDEAKAQERLDQKNSQT